MTDTSAFQFWQGAALSAGNRRQLDPASSLSMRVLHTVLVFVLAITVSALPVATHFVSMPLAIVTQICLASMVAVYLTPAAPLVVLFTLIFQNFFVSLFSDFLVSADDYNFVRGYNFLTMIVIWLWLFGRYALNWRDHDRETNRIMGVGFIAFCLIGVYLILGMAKNPTGAVIYLRNIIAPFALFQIYFLVSLKFPTRLNDQIVALTGIIVGLGLIEAIDRSLWMDITNGWTLWTFGTTQDRLNLVWDAVVARQGTVMTDIFDSMRVHFLNTPLLGDNGFTILRMSGPNNHAISYSYLLSMLALVMMFTGRAWWFVFLFPLMLLSSAKGALIMLLLVCCAALARWLFGAMIALAGLLVVLVIYFVLGVKIGLDIGDFHVLGFMGGVHDFLSNPFGRGLGDGGNFTTDFSKLDWPAYQAAGRTPFAIESAVGVLMRQMGIAGFMLLGCYAWVAAQTFKLSLQSRVMLHSVLSFSLMIILVNGVFQEEALFAPMALGAIMALNGHVLGNWLRAGVPARSAA
ncbi:hypothetical protein [Cohaesibacter intestini]|uniref:hypothetical protein n=1 Tax=Cohaesibacter intestini TaxID=2211145 RepID=UPI000DEB8D19|nr:hypothetical protein [Cohaesibacter intestini]